MERMASEQAHDSLSHSSHDAVAVHGFEHVHRAGRLEPAGRRQHGGYPPLIETQTGLHEFAHLVTIRLISRRRSSAGASNTGRLGFTTMSHCGAISGRRRRKASRMRRRARLRRTARPKARGTVNPTRGPESRSTRRQNAAKYGPEMREPLS